jgi:hypothetical protein
MTWCTRVGTCSVMAISWSSAPPATHLDTNRVWSIFKRAAN